MIKRSVADEVMDELRRLDKGERRQVLEYARSLGRSSRNGVSGEALLEHFGAWSDEEANAIAEAIEEGCERVNLDAW